MGIVGLGRRMGGIMLLLVIDLYRAPYLQIPIYLKSLGATTRRLIGLISGVLTKEFLDFTASRGNNLRSIGLEPGCKWCLCTARWKEAVDAAKGPDDPVVPKYVSLFFFRLLLLLFLLSFHLRM